MSDKQAAAMLDKKLDKISAQARSCTGHVYGTENAARRSLAFAGIVEQCQAL